MIDQLRHVRLRKLKPASVNDKVYRPVDPDDPEIVALADSIRKDGLIHPIVVTTDNVILSGHRRYVACRLAALDPAPVQVHPIHSSDPAFVHLLVSCNTQREKTRDERMRESVVQADPDEVYQALLQHRESEASVSADRITLKSRKNRKLISQEKRDMAEAIIRVVNVFEPYWPMSVRSIHYQLLNEIFFFNSRRKTKYLNNLKCYKCVCDMATRMRLTGELPFWAIADETRTTYEWNVHQSTGTFVENELNEFLKGYRRNLQQSQPNHLEVIVEKNTVIPILKDVAGRYGIPITSARGFASIPPRKAIADRFERSGREKLILIVCSDFDPEGEAIPEQVTRSLRDDFHIGGSVECVKATMTHAQVTSMNLPSDIEAKKSSPSYKEFTKQFGTQTYELEALAPEVLQGLLSNAVDSVLDVEAFNAELEEEKRDAIHLMSLRREVQGTLAELWTDMSDGGQG